MSELVGLLKCAPPLPPGPQPLALGMGRLPSSLPPWNWPLSGFTSSVWFALRFPAPPPSPLSLQPLPPALPSAAERSPPLPLGSWAGAGVGWGGGAGVLLANGKCWNVTSFQFPLTGQGQRGALAQFGGVVYSLLLLL